MADAIAVEKNMPPATGEKAGARLWPVATVMAPGIFATAFVQHQGLGYLPFNRRLQKVTKLDSDHAATFIHSPCCCEPSRS